MGNKLQVQKQNKLRGTLYWERKVLLYNTEQELEQDLETLKNIKNIYFEEQETNEDAEHMYRLDLDLYINSDANIKTTINNLKLHGTPYMERRQYKYKTEEDAQKDIITFGELDWEIFDEWETEHLYPGYVYSVGINKPDGDRETYINY